MGARWRRRGLRSSACRSTVGWTCQRLNGCSDVTSRPNAKRLMRTPKQRRLSASHFAQARITQRHVGPGSHQKAALLQPDCDGAVERCPSIRLNFPAAPSVQQGPARRRPLRSDWAPYYGWLARSCTSVSARGDPNPVVRSQPVIVGFPAIGPGETLPSALYCQS